MSLYKIFNDYEDIEENGKKAKEELGITENDMDFKEKDDIVDNVWKLCIDRGKSTLRTNSVDGEDIKRGFDRIIEKELGILKFNSMDLNVYLNETDSSFIKAIKEHVIFSSYHTILCMIADLQREDIGGNISLYRLVTIHCKNDTKFRYEYENIIKKTKSNFASRYKSITSDKCCELKDGLQLFGARFDRNCTNNRMFGLLVDILDGWNDCPFNKPKISYKNYRLFMKRQTRDREEVLNNKTSGGILEVEGKEDNKVFKVNNSTEYAKERLFGFNIVDEIIKLAESFVDYYEDDDFLFIPYDEQNGSNIYVLSEELSKEIFKEEILLELEKLEINAHYQYLQKLYQELRSKLVSDKYMVAIHPLEKFRSKLTSEQKEVIFKLEKNNDEAYNHYVMQLFPEECTKAFISKIIIYQAMNKVTEEFTSKEELERDEYVEEVRNKHSDALNPGKCTKFIDRIIVDKSAGRVIEKNLGSYEEVKALNDSVIKQYVFNKACINVSGKNDKNQMTLKVPKEHFAKFLSVLCKFVLLPNVFSRREFMYLAINTYLYHFSINNDISTWERIVNEFIKHYSTNTFPKLEKYFLYSMWKSTSNAEYNNLNNLENIRDILVPYIEKNNYNFTEVTLLNTANERIYKLKNLDDDFWNKVYLGNIQEALSYM